MTDAPKWKPRPVVRPGELVFAAARLDDGHNFGRVADGRSRPSAWDAARAVGVYGSTTEIASRRSVERRFVPAMHPVVRPSHRARESRAVERARAWPSP